MASSRRGIIQGCVGDGLDLFSSMTYFGQIMSKEEIMSDADTIRRTPEGRFAPGRSGNPAGRPKGSRNRATILAETLAASEDRTLLRLLLDRAHGGDQVALRFVLARLLPRPRPEPARLDLAEGAEADSAAAHAATVRAVADGEITPEEGAAIGRLLAAKAPVMAAHLVERRLADFAAAAQAAAEQRGDEQNFDDE